MVAKNPLASISRKGSAFVLLLLLLLLFVLAGCGGEVEQRVTFYRNERWEAELITILPAEAATLVGIPEVERQLDAAVAEIRAAGGKASWSNRTREGNVEFTIGANGEGYALLQEVVLPGAEINTIELDGRRAIQVSYLPDSDFSLTHTTITFVGGDVISSNGLVIEKGVVQWVNPTGRLEAVLTEKSGFNLVGVLVLGIAGVLVVGGVGWLWKSRRANKVAYSQCIQCGHWLSPDAQFCPNCGTQSFTGNWR